MNGLLNPFILGAGGFVPSVTPTFWHKAYSLALGNGDPVVTWPDSAGNGFDVSATGGDVLFETNQFNGKPAVRFQNSEGGYLSRATPGFDLTSRMIFLVFQETPHINNAGILIFPPPAGGDDFNSDQAVLYTTDSSNNGFGIFGGAGIGYFISGLSSSNALHIWSEIFEFDGANFTGRVFLDGVEQATDQYDDFMQSQDGFAYGVRYTGGAFNTSLVPNMRMTEGVGYFPSPGVAVHDEWIAYLKDFYAIP